MSIFKCINCGQTKESEERCSCSRCGYTMYQAPYDKKTVLLKECRRFLKAILSPDVKREDFDFYRTELEEETDEEIIIYKSEDDARFPSFDKIKGYILSARTSELAIERAKTSLNKINNHISTRYQQRYQVANGRALAEIKKKDKVVDEAMNALGRKCVHPDVQIPLFTLYYSEEPNKELLELSRILIGSLELLADKMLRYIRQNNAYGAMKIAEECRLNFADNSSPSRADVLALQLSRVRAVLAKSYVVDILSDGYEELQEMAEAFVLGIQALLEFSALEPSYCYQFEDGDIIFGDGFLAKSTRFCLTAILITDHL